MSRVVCKKAKQLFLISSSSVAGFGFLEYAAEDIKAFLQKNNVKVILFIPYAQTNHDEYLEKVRIPFNKWGFKVEGIHQSCCPVKTLETAEAIFVGGGNTFLLLKTLYEKNFLGIIRETVEGGTPYIGSSAGTNIATTSINTTNDMPIVYPPSFDALGLVPFNINPHFIDPDLNSTHRGETREQRIMEYVDFGKGKVVLAMREGVHLVVEGNVATLTGLKDSRIFMKGESPREYPPGSDVSFLLTEKTSKND